ncbi:cytidine/deoxycytidylate deaminase family protein isoform X2 [Wolffia australiana]
MFICAAKFSGSFLRNSWENLVLLKNDDRSSIGVASDRFLFRTRTMRGNSTCVRSEGRDDAYYMRKCVDLARRAVGCTSPNPMVGCVIVKGGEVVGEGFHPKAGQPHAEVFALRDAGEQAEDAIAYVSLEPCNHYGRTPPCTEALIKAKVKRVVVGMVDPNPIVASKGVEKLRNAGIDVAVGVEEALCKRLNEAYIHRMLSQRPFVTIRYTLAINGGGIINHIEKQEKELGGYYSLLLQESDGIIISCSSLEQYSTLPTSQEPGAKQPAIIIIVPKEGPPLSIPASVDPSRQIMIFLESGATIDPDTEKTLNLLGIEKVMLYEVAWKIKKI